MTSKPISVISYPRSGSNLFLQLLGDLDSIKPLFEIFHSDEQTFTRSMEGLWPSAKAWLAAAHLPTTMENLRQQPMDLIHALSEQVKGRLIAFKLFPQHLDASILEDFLRLTTPVFLVRNLLDSWISEKIAQKKGIWRDIDTSQNKVDFNPVEFVCRSLAVGRFIRFCLGLYSARNLPWLWYDYTDICEGKTFMPVLAHDLGHLLGRDAALSNKPIQIRKIKKQDTRMDILDKLTNPGPATAWLKSWEMDDLLDMHRCTDFIAIQGKLETVASFAEKDIALHADNP